MTSPTKTTHVSFRIPTECLQRLDQVNVLTGLTRTASILSMIDDFIISKMKSLKSQSRLKALFNEIEKVQNQNDDLDEMIEPLMTNNSAWCVR